MTDIRRAIDINDRPAGLFDNLAAALLAVMFIGRIVIPELPFRTSPFMGIDSGDGVILAPHHIDLASMTFGVMILLAAVFWLLDRAMRRRLEIRAGSLGLLIALFAAWSLGSAIQAGDKRGAMVFWMNQAGLMLAGWLAIQLCARSKHRAMLLALLAAAGILLAIVGLRQVFIDAPERIADFEQRGSDILTARGWAPNSPEAIAFKERLFKAVPLGFFSLANIFASTMIVLTASLIGLAVDRWRRILPDRRKTAVARKKGEIHLPTLAASLLTATAPLCVAALVLAFSRGATAFATLTGLTAAFVLRFRDRLAVHWRRWTLAAVLVIGIVAGTVVAYGLARDSLIAKTMTFRWYYWTAGAEIAVEKPVWGVGPGGFGAAYEAIRRPAAEEAVKSPHNFAVHAIAQYGLPGGLLYLCILGVAIFRLCKPVDDSHDKLDPNRRGGPAAAIVWIPLAAAVSMCVFAGARGAGGAMLISAIEPAVILAIALAAVLWWGPRFSHAAADPRGVTRVVLACGLVGFILHNSVTFSLWMPGAAGAFWLGAGAVISLTRPAARDVSRFRWFAVGAATSALAAVIVMLWLPVARRSWATEKAVDRLIAKDPDAALKWAEKAAERDRLDHIAAADVADLLHRSGRKQDSAPAYHWATEAIRRNPLASSNHRLAADILWDSGQIGSKWLDHMLEAVKRDPQSISMRMRFAERLVSAGNGELATEQLTAIDAINGALARESIYRLSQAKLARIEALKARAAELCDHQ